MITPRLAPARLPPAERIYAIGDVHGCAGRLAALHQSIDVDLHERPVARATILHLGDYVDRGPDSARIVADLAGRGGGSDAVRRLNLMGNHERMMLDALSTSEPGTIERWLDNGGMATLESWGVAPSVEPAQWAELVPQTDLEFLRNLPLTHRAGGYLFVHAGLRPGRAIDDQVPDDLLWIREPFLSFDGDFGSVVVHGHTPVAEPVIRSNRIGIDTGAVFGGKLTCAVLEADQVGFLQA
jgi:serine/threonine protein phosphatase 1